MDSCIWSRLFTSSSISSAVVITFVLLFFVNFVLTVVYFNFVPQKV